MAIADTIESIKTNISNAYDQAETMGATIPQNKNLENLEETIASIPSGGGTPLFTGHYDSEGLSTIGWSNEEIQYYQDNGVQWNLEDDELFELTDTELAGDDSATTRFIPKSSTKTNFRNYYNLIAIPSIDLSNKLDGTNLFNNCYSITAIPEINVGRMYELTNAFYNCYSLEKMQDTLNTSNCNAMTNIFRYCYSLEKIPQMDTSKVTSLNYSFAGCYRIKTIPKINTSRVTNMGYAFNNCSSLKEIPQIDTSSVTTMNGTFNGCVTLKTVPELDVSSCENFNSIFGVCTMLTYLGGLKNAGMAYSTSQATGYSNYTINLSASNYLTHDSLMNVINDLYDIATKGCNPQKLQLGSTNLNKLSQDEKNIAINKGWTLS